jgi:hypothetical protein
VPVTAVVISYYCTIFVGFAESGEPNFKNLIYGRALHSSFLARVPTCLAIARVSCRNCSFYGVAQTETHWPFCRLTALVL